MKDLPNIIELQLLAIDFKNTSFMSNSDCAISKACRRQLGGTVVEEVVNCTYIDNVLYNHIGYSYNLYLEDKDVALTVEPNTVIRTLTLTRDV